MLHSRAKYNFTVCFSDFTQSSLGLDHTKHRLQKTCRLLSYCFSCQWWFLLKLELIKSFEYFTVRLYFENNIEALLSCPLAKQWNFIGPENLISYPNSSPVKDTDHLCYQLDRNMKHLPLLNNSATSKGQEGGEIPEDMRKRNTCVIEKFLFAVCVCVGTLTH